MRAFRTRDAASRRVGAVTVAVLLSLATGCGAAPPESPPSGVDELVVPTPEPDPADFVAEIDNPWLPLRPGAAWTWRIRTSTGTSTEITRVLEATRQVAGVAATQVRTETSGDGGEGSSETVAWFAQDRRGNVWALGEEGEWEAGRDGAQAGLAMPASPRRGDGFARYAVDGEPREVVRVGERELSATVPAGRYRELLETAWTSGDDATRDGAGWQVYSARGVGEVLRVERDGTGRAELVEHQRAD